MLLLTAAAQAGGPIPHDLYEWHPNGERNGPQLILEDKVDVSGKFGVQCGKEWIYTYYGGGGSNDPFTLNASTGAIAGSALFPAGTVGLGSDYRNAEINFYDFKSAGPTQVTLSGQATPAAATGVLGLRLYRLVKPRHRGAKAKRELSASCQVHFEAPNFYYEPPAPPEAPPQESSAG